ncbi:MAG: hypothetical protein GY711_33920 [bacterium]|nr:hypothetical protein [bacterium]
MKSIAVLSLVCTAIAGAMFSTSAEAVPQGPMAVPLDIVPVPRSICTQVNQSGACVTQNTTTGCFLTYSGTFWTCSDSAGNIWP